MHDVPEGVKVHLPGGWRMPPFGVHQYLAMVIVAIALWVLGSFWLGLQATNQWVGSWQEQLTLHVYLPNIDQKDMPRLEQLSEALKALPDIEDVQQISREQSSEWVKKWLGETAVNVKSLVEQLPETLNVILAEVSDDFVVSDIRDIAEHFGGLMNEEEIHLLKVHDILDQVETLAWFVTVMLALAMTLIISNTLRMILLARAEEVHLMRLLGAKEWFVRLPFILEGLTLGAASGVLSWLLLWPVDWLAMDWLDASSVDLNLWILFFPLCVGGACVGALGALIATARLVSPDSTQAEV